jgi:hypothetical protein
VQVTTAVVDGPEVTGEKPLREPVGVHLVRFVAARFTASIAYDHAIGYGHQQVMQPLALGAFLNYNMNRTAHAPDKLDEHTRLGGQNAPGDHAAALLANCRHGCCLMNVERHILGRPLHEGRSLV